MGLADDFTNKESESGLYTGNKVSQLARWMQHILDYFRRQKAVTPDEYDIEGEAVASSSYSCCSITIGPPFTPLTVLAIILSFLPMLSIVVLLVAFAVWKSSYALFSCGVVACTSLMNDFGLKKIFKQPRPPKSAASTYGMPSSHCASCYALITCLALDLVARRCSEPTTCRNRKPVAIPCVIGLILTPWARVQLEDHSIMQCFVGCVVGIFTGVVFYFVESLLLGN